LKRREEREERKRERERREREREERERERAEGKQQNEYSEEGTRNRECEKEMFQVGVTGGGRMG